MRGQFNEASHAFFTRQTLCKPGVDVMITIFSNFCQFSAKKLAFFSKSKKIAVILKKPANIFAKFFAENIFLNHNIGP
jgi:hypothetical protein